MLKVNLNFLSKFGSASLKVLIAFGGILVLGLIIKFMTFSKTKGDPDKEFEQEITMRYAVFAMPLPDKIDFAGEETPLKNFDVRESLDRELLVNTYWQSQTLLFFKRANRYFQVIEPILKKNGVPDDFKYVAVIESGLMNVTSPAGAKGIWQFLEKTAEQYNLEISNEVDERYHLEKSTEAACKFFKDSYRAFKSWTLVATSYNIGSGGLQKQITAQKINNFYDLQTNDETSRYIYRVLALKFLMTNPQKYGFHFRKKDLYSFIPTNDVKVDSTISNLVDFAEKSSINLKMLKFFNPWLRQNSLTIKNGKTYIIKIPKEGFRTLETDDTELSSDTIKKIMPDLQPQLNH